MAVGLAGLRVVEVADGASDGFSAAMAGKLLADLGATVLKVEPPGGDPVRRMPPFAPGRSDVEASGIFAALNTSKRSLVLELASADGQRRLSELAVRCDVLIHSVPPSRMKTLHLDYSQLSANNPALVMLSITPYGLSGPYRDLTASDLTLMHGSGFAWLCPDGSPHTDLPPLKFPGHQAWLQAGLHGAAIALAAVRGARQQGTGEHVEIAVQEVMAMLLGRHFPAYTYGGQEESRLTFNVTEPANFFPCSDGTIFLLAVEEDQWSRLVQLMGAPEWTRAPEVANRTLRGQHRELVVARVTEWTRGWRVEELFHTCQRERIGAAPVYRFEQVERDAHLRERGFFVPHQHPEVGELRLPGAPYRLREPWWALRNPAPTLGEAGPAFSGPRGTRPPFRTLVPNRLRSP